MIGASMGLPANSRRFVLDAWPVMEWLKDAGVVAERFDSLLAKGEAGEVELMISQITVGEIFYVTAKRYGMVEAEQLLALIEDWTVSIIEASEARVLAAARLKAAHSISYGDAFVAALSLESNAPVLTGDTDFLQLERAVGLQVEWMGA